MLRVDEPARHRVLVVDDEPHIADALTVALRHVGYDARAAYDGTSALASAEAWSPDLLLLDVMLPDMSGYDVCRQLVLTGGGAGFLSARDEVSDRIRGFGVGADDYVAKPFSLEEVLARVRAVLLRRERGRAPEAEDSVLRYQDLELDDDKHLVTRARVPIELSPTEYTLLRFLLQNAERVMSKEQILGHVWHYEFRGNGNVVETFVSTLRKKLALAGPNLIQTVRGFGYVLRADRR